MKALLYEIRTSLFVTIILVIILCGLYPLGIFGVAQLVFPRQANGSLVRSPSGQIIGSELIGQRFDDPRYFHPRPSAAGSGYDAANSGGSNLGPLSQTLQEQIIERIRRYRAENGLLPGVKIPADAVTVSASGLDPHISPANAALQAARVAKVRGLELSKVQQLIRQQTDRRQFGILGEDGVNVLRLNLALDRIVP
jgi:K+-transporting ATPase ATPase C chain